MVNIFYFLVASFLIISCNDAVIRPFQDKFPDLKLNTDGYYISTTKGKTMSFFEGIVFFENGTSKRFYGSAHESFFSEDFFFNRVNAAIDEKKGWGVWKVENGIIEIHYWGASSGGGLPKVKRKGKIISSTSFCLEEEEDSGFEKYALYPSDKKPDGANHFFE